jgi:hypothetical protein
MNFPQQCTRLSWVLALTATLAFTSNAVAQKDNTDNYAGSYSFPGAPKLSDNGSLGTIKPSIRYANSAYATGGVSLRNRGAGNISVSGLPGATTAAFLYWAVITPTAAVPAAAANVQIQRLFPGTSAAVVVPGVPVGAGPGPCWLAGSTVTVFRAVVPLAVATGNGSYQLTILPGGTGLANGANPWAAPLVTPAWEGASLVLVGPGAGVVSIFDAGLAGRTFVAPFNYSLALPVATAAGRNVLFDNIGADGQHGFGRNDFNVGIADETTTIGILPIAGPGSNYSDSDWNGSSGLPLPELWDDTGHDITAAVPPGTNLLNVRITQGGGGVLDCLVPVANVLQE